MTVLKPLVASSFLLTEAASVSDVLQSGDIFFVIKLSKVDPKRALTLEEVRPLAEAQIRSHKAVQANRADAEGALKAIRQAMASGQTFAEAAVTAGRKTWTFSSIDLTTDDLTPEQQQVARATILLSPGELSGFLPTPEGGFAVFLESRAALDTTGPEGREIEVKAGILEGKRRLLFMSWLHSARDKANISMGSRSR